MPDPGDWCAAKMSGPSIDLEERNPIGGLDRFVTSAGLAIIAVFPSLAMAFFTPWKLVKMLEPDDPDGREGLLLSPGTYFALSLTVTLILAASLANQDILEFNNSVIGPNLAVKVAEAANDGNIWKIISIIAPIYFLAIAIGFAGSSLKRWAGDWWTLRVSLRAAFYQMATVVSWIILSSAIIEKIRTSTGNHEIAMSLYSLNSIPIFGLTIWFYFWIFKSNNDLSSIKSGILGATMLGFLALIILCTGVILRM